MAIAVTHHGVSQVASGSSATNTITPSNWTPQANALLLVCVNLVSGDGGSGTATFSVADTFVGTGSWSEGVTFGGTLDNGAGYSHRESIFVAQAGPTPGSHSLTVTRSAGTLNQWFWIDVYEVTGHNTAAPVVGTATGNGGSGVNVSTDLDPALGLGTTSAVFATATLGGVGGSVLQIPTGWTGGGDSFDPGFTNQYRSAYVIGTAGDSVWASTGLNGNGLTVAALEIGVAVPVISATLAATWGAWAGALASTATTPEEESESESEDVEHGATQFMNIDDDVAAACLVRNEQLEVYQNALIAYDAALH